MKILLLGSIELCHEMLLQGTSRVVVLSFHCKFNQTRIPHRMEIPAIMRVVTGSVRSVAVTCSGQMEMNMNIIPALVSESRTVQWLVNISDKTGGNSDGGMGRHAVSFTFRVETPTSRVLGHYDFLYLLSQEHERFLGSLAATDCRLEWASAS